MCVEIMKIVPVTLLAIGLAMAIPMGSIRPGINIDSYAAVGKCPPVQGSDPVYLPDDKNCSIFYECSRDGVPLPLVCRPGLHFNPVLCVCDYPESAGCTAEDSRKMALLSAIGECPAGLVFNPKLSVCDYPENGKSE